MAFQFDVKSWPAAVIPSIELLLIAVLSIQAVRLLWAFATPVGALGVAPAFQPQQKADFAVLSRFDPFFRGLSNGGASAPPSAYTLFGVRMAPDGRSSAILAGPDGVQKSYVVGEMIAPGLVLTAVSADRAELSRADARLQIVFQRPTPSTLPNPPVTPATPAADAGSGTLVPKAFLSQTIFQPREQNGQVLGYAVAPRDAGQALQQAGLQPGDVIRSINGSALSRHRFEEIESEFAGASQVELTVERGGQIITKSLRVTQ